MNTLLRSRPVPLASFTAVMGIIGTGLDVRSTHAFGNAGRCIGDSVDALGVVIFIILTARWLLRVRSNRVELAAESARPSAAGFYGAIFISVSLTAAAVAPYCVPAARALWLITTAGGIALVLYLFGLWIQAGIDRAELTPSIFLPVVGNAASVYAAAQIGVAPFAWFSFSLAIICWMMLLPLILYRLIAVSPRLPRRMAPQLGVLIAAPAVLANSWYVLNGGRVDGLMITLAGTSLFFALLTIRLWRLAWGEPFNVAMWGWLFAAAALTGSFERIALDRSDALSGALAGTLLWLTIIIALACGASVLRGWLHQALQTSLNPDWSRK